MRDIAGGGKGDPAVEPCLLLLFPDGARPTARDIRAILASAGVGEPSFDPASSGAPRGSTEWLEVVVDGLTFDLLGLAPGAGLSASKPRHCFGLVADDLIGCEAIGLAPGPHLAGAANALPVVRTMLRLGSVMMAASEVGLGSLWLPASGAMRRDLFIGTIDSWLGGGPFPALGLTGVEVSSEGLVGSDGLAFFTGQEIVLDAGLSADRLAATRLVARLVDRLVAEPPLIGMATLQREEGGEVRLEGKGSRITVSAE